MIPIEGLDKKSLKVVQFKQKNYSTHHVRVGFGSPTHRHSNEIFEPSSLCRICGRSVKVGLMPSSGTGASSPKFLFILRFR